MVIVNIVLSILTINYEASGHNSFLDQSVSNIININVRNNDTIKIHSLNVKQL